MRFLIWAVLYCLVFTPSTYALKLVHCNGMVQFRPCDETIQSDLPRQVALSRSYFARARPKRQAYAKISQETFTDVGKRRGSWKGRVEGNGTIHLHLHINANGRSETRYMGNISLINKSTSFRFDSSIPTTPDWTWKISASAS